MSKVVTANTLSTGMVVFMGPDDAWVADIAAARIFADAADADTALEAAKADEKRALIVDPFVVTLKSGQEGAAAMSLRDAIRAYGPTIAYLPQSGAA